MPLTRNGIGRDSKMTLEAAKLQKNLHSAQVEKKSGKKMKTTWIKL